MNSLVIYGTRFGNTEKISRAIAEELRSSGAVKSLLIEEVDDSSVKGADLLVIGGPTENHRLTAPMKQFLESFQPGALESVAAVAFDTRYRKPRWYSGSAAGGISKLLRRAGAREVIPQESFFVRGQPAELEWGELERATAWGKALAEKVEAAQATVPPSQ